VRAQIRESGQYCEHSSTSYQIKPRPFELCPRNLRSDRRSSRGSSCFVDLALNHGARNRKAGDIHFGSGTRIGAGGIFWMRARVFPGPSGSVARGRERRRTMPGDCSTLARTLRRVRERRAQFCHPLCSGCGSKSTRMCRPQLFGGVSSRVTTSQDVQYRKECGKGCSWTIRTPLCAAQQPAVDYENAKRACAGKLRCPAYLTHLSYQETNICGGVFTYG